MQLSFNYLPRVVHSLFRRQYNGVLHSSKNHFFWPVIRARSYKRPKTCDICFSETFKYISTTTHIMLSMYLYRSRAKDSVPDPGKVEEGKAVREWRMCMCGVFT